MSRDLRQSPAGRSSVVLQKTTENFATEAQPIRAGSYRRRAYGISAGSLLSGLPADWCGDLPRSRSAKSELRSVLHKGLLYYFPIYLRSILPRELLPQHYKYPANLHG